MTYCYTCSKKARHIIFIGRHVPVCDEHEEEAQMEEGPLFSCDIDEWGSYAPPARAVEYRVTMQDGSIFSWSAVGMDSLFRELLEKKYKPVHVQVWSEWELEQQENQREWNWKAERDIEGEKTA